MKQTLMGNEAIAYGLLHANTQMISGYPGTPSSEILTTFEKISKNLPVYAKWATNEKVGFEVAYAGAIAGLNTAVTMKQVGLNVASDALMSASFIGNKGGFVLIVADDPGFHSSQTEQDSREFARFARIPVLDPATPAEAYEFAIKASELSQKFGIPVMLRSVMRVSHSREIVEVKDFNFEEKKGSFKRDIPRWAAVPRAGRLGQAYEREKKLKEIAKYSYENFIKPEIEKLKGTKNLIISSGAAFGYVKETLDELGLDIDVLKIDMPYPLPLDELKSLIKHYEKVLIIEETYPVIEEELRSENVYGKMSGDVHTIDEMTKERVLKALKNVGFYKGENIYKPAFENNFEVISRKPNLCSGCPHRDIFFAIKKVFRPKKSIYPSDIGCYTLGINQQAIDTVLCMGASVSMAHGFSIADNKKTVIATIGDSTFFHSGVAPLINAVYQKAKFILVILDNSTVAMTGRQATPERAAPGEVDLKKVVEGCGAEVMEYCYEPDIKKTIEFFKEVKKRYEEVEVPLVVISRQFCVLDKERAKENLKGVFATVDEEKCVACDVCTTQFVCPPMAYNEKGKIEIDPLLCVGCGVCISGICPTDAFIRRDK
ncbi:indolepyruvate ferredoxin oxidoreductase, alpha subunit [Lebetimonas natsushimae]|uniref:Indolepyruvate oxidoreductase subunit IorA n=1 Tax=Lebetimonas natsushimae TaxID=1936991 RepID=A0A292Y9J6_9BACT|nr:thiamine pyrophosphate-dependent enzyme [Lebetimonas natsushimae]GAX87572.1 indolepyruvate ferredoxin oxidoreductase, alpha subunit [Lebetimonas natsushimae]